MAAKRAGVYPERRRNRRRSRAFTRMDRSLRGEARRIPPRAPNTILTRIAADAMGADPKEATFWPGDADSGKPRLLPQTAAGAGSAVIAPGPHA
jgi:hypothetical protein